MAIYGRKLLEGLTLFRDGATMSVRSEHAALGAMSPYYADYEYTASTGIH